MLIAFFLVFQGCTVVRFLSLAPYIKKECWLVPQAFLVAKPLTKGELEITLTLNELGLFLEF